MDASKRAQELLEKLELMEDSMEKDGDMYVLKQTIAFTDLPVSLRKEIQKRYYGEETETDIEEDVFVQQCVSVDTSGEQPKIQHLGFYLFDIAVKLEGLYSTGDCQAANDWVAFIEEKIHTTMD